LSKRIKLFVGAVIIASSVIVPFGSTASAMTCSPDIAPACAVVAKVVCGVVAKGQPCLA
jgi:hypothetical protein